METKTRIFTADANLDFCRMLERVAAAEKDMEIVGTAADGAEALTKIAELRPDVVLLELVLPTLDGLEVLRRMPETGCKPSIIVLSGLSTTMSSRHAPPPGRTSSSRSPAPRQRSSRASGRSSARRSQPRPQVC